MKFILLFILITLNLSAQDLYKTPYGKKYHLSTCRMVENVSKKLNGENDIQKYSLKPCKICKPPTIKLISKSFSLKNKAVGTSKNVRCKSLTKRGTRCKHKTSLSNRLCYQHVKNRNNSSNKKKYTKSSKCGRKNKSGGYCKRKVKGGGPCHQHK